MKLSIAFLAAFIATLSLLTTTGTEDLVVETRQPTTTTTEPATVETVAVHKAIVSPSLSAAYRDFSDFDFLAHQRLAEILGTVPPPREPTDLELWIQGYRDAGAPPSLIDRFTAPRGIIFCESGFDVDVISRTSDVGFAQINQIHRPLIRQTFGDGDWKELMQDPYNNGFMSGLLTIDAGGTQPWYRSRHCHGYGNR